MKKFLNQKQPYIQVTLAQKLSKILLLTTGIAIILSTLVFTISNAIKLYNDTQQQLLSLALIVSHNTEAALLFNDSNSAKTTLSALQAKSEIEAAIIYDANKKLFAMYTAKTAKHDYNYLLEPLLVDILHLKVEQTISRNREVIGYIVLYADMYNPWLNLVENLFFNTSLSLLSMLLAVLLGIRLSNSITQPIMALARTANQVTQQRNYNIHIKRSHFNEINTLIDNFDFMLKEILLRDQQLHNHQEHLEADIVKRTKELSQALSNLQTTQTHLIQSEKMAALGILVAGVAHEINNPVNFLHLGAYNLKQAIEQQKQFLLPLLIDEPEIITILKRQYQQQESSLDSIEEGCERIKNIVDDLRTFSRLDEASRKVVNIIDSLKSTIHITQTHYQKNIKIVTDFQAQPELECWPAKLNQVFMNIIVNSCHAIEQQQQITALEGLLIISSIEKNKELIICFQDNGCGMSDEIKNKMFEPFFTTKAVGQGTGLGMSLSYGIIQEHHGRIEVTSQLGQGTSTRIYLPLQAS